MRDLPKGRCTGPRLFVYISKYAATNVLLPEDEHSVSLLKRMLDPAQQHYTKEKNVTGREFAFGWVHLFLKLQDSSRETIQSRALEQELLQENCSVPSRVTTNSRFSCSSFHFW
jgi:hypothetical protein